MIPRDVVEGRCYKIRRACILDQALFDPANARHRRAVRYCLSAAAQKHGVQLITARIDTTELEVIIADPRAHRPDFMRDACRWISGCMSKLLERTGPFWHPEPYSCTWLQDVETIIDAAVVMSVDRRDDEKADEDGWPLGLLFKPCDFRRRVRSRRPSVYFSTSRSALPDRVSAPLRPLGGMGVDEWVDTLTRRIGARRDTIDAQAPADTGDEEAGVSMGPTLVAPVGHRFNAVAGCDSAAVAEAVAWRARFQVRYAKRLERWCKGERSVVFPYGTWWMDVFHRAQTPFRRPGNCVTTISNTS